MGARETWDGAPTVSPAARKDSGTGSNTARPAAPPPVTAAQWDDAHLDHHLHRGDAAADQALSALVGSLPGGGIGALHQAFGQLRPVTDNGALAALKTGAPAAPVSAQANTPAAALSAALAACDVLPPWADEAKIARAEQLFREGGVMSGVLFFCASLPEVYAAPDISSLLHVTGSLEQATDQRIRATSAMILSVLMPGGLSKPAGAGRSKVFKARFVHSAMRHLFLRGDPAALAGNAVQVPPLDGATGASPFERAWHHGWDVARDGVPCNQEEQSYTLLTFGYVYLRSLRRLGLGLPRADELAYLHLWNVVGSLLGIGEALLAHTMEDAETLFDRLQRRAIERVRQHDARPMLGGALVDTIEKSVAHPWLRPACALLVRHLCSDSTARQLGLDKRYTWPARLLFGAAMATVRLADKAVRLVRPRFSLVRFTLRIAGYRLVHAVLTDMRNPIDLPDAVRQEVNVMLDEWSSDDHAPAWLNHVERYLTTRQLWRMSIGV